MNSDNESLAIFSLATLIFFLLGLLSLAINFNLGAGICLAVVLLTGSCALGILISKIL